MLREIVATRKGRGGDITDVQLNDGTELTIHEAIHKARMGLIAGVVVGKNREGEDTLRSMPDGDIQNNLSHLPDF